MLLNIDSQGHFGFKDKEMEGRQYLEEFRKKIVGTHGTGIVVRFTVKIANQKITFHVVKKLIPKPQ